MVDRHDNEPKSELSSELQAFEAQLASLRPTTGRLERDRLLFEAGKAAAVAEHASPTRSTHWAWSAVSTVMTAAAAVLLAVVLMHPGDQVVEKPAEPTEEAPSRSTKGPGKPPARLAPEGEHDRQDLVSPETLLASLLFADARSRDEFRKTYLGQRDMLLALGGDRLPELKETSPAKGGRSNTRVSYADLLDELTLEAQGFAPGNDGSDRLRPSYQGTDL